MDYPATGGEPSISTVVIDSREAVPGSLFVAFGGQHADGHLFVDEAFKRGAIAAFVERPVDSCHAVIDVGRSWIEQGYEAGPALPQPLCVVVQDTLAALQAIAKAWRARFPGLHAVGITGSVGKTTTKELTHAVLSSRYRTLKSEGNYNNEIGLPLTLLEVRPWHEYAVLEMGMYTTGEINLLCDLARPQIGVVTLVGAVHMEWLGSIEAIAAAKQELVTALPPAPEGVAILNKDEPLVMAMANHTEARVVTYGLDPTADFWADEIRSIGLGGIRFTLHHDRDQFVVQVPLLGRHSVHTSLRAAAVGHVAGLTWDEIVAGLQSLTSQLRLVAVPGPRNSIILDDTYNSSPESAIAALNLLADLDGRRIAVLGDMLELGPVEESSHRMVGRRARNVADILVAVGNLGKVIGQEALVAGLPQERVFLVDDPAATIRLLDGIIEPGDVILVKGSRGAHLEQIVTALGKG